MAITHKLVVSDVNLMDGGYMYINNLKLFSLCMDTVIYSS